MTATIPYPMTISFENKIYTVNNDKKIPLSPGNYAVVFSAKGFKNQFQDITIKDKQTLHIPVVLTPITDEAKKEAASSKYDSIREEVTGLQMDINAAANAKKYPLIGKLPIYAAKFSITPCHEELSTQKPGICIESTDDEATALAIDTLHYENNSNDLSKYTIYVNDTLFTAK